MGISRTSHSRPSALLLSLVCVVGAWNVAHAKAEHFDTCALSVTMPTGWRVQGVSSNEVTLDEDECKGDVDIDVIHIVCGDAAPGSLEPIRREERRSLRGVTTRHLRIGSAEARLLGGHRGDLHVYLRTFSDAGRSYAVTAELGREKTKTILPAFWKELRVTR